MANHRDFRCPARFIARSLSPFHVCCHHLRFFHFSSSLFMFVSILPRKGLLENLNSVWDDEIQRDLAWFSMMRSKGDFVWFCFETNLPTKDIWSSLHQLAVLETSQSGWPSDLELVVRQKEVQEPNGKPSEAMFSTSTGKLTLKTSCFRTGLKIVILDFCCVLEFEEKVGLRLFPKTLKNINLQRLFPKRCGLEEHSFTLATFTTSILSHYIGSLILIPITVLQH